MSSKFETEMWRQMSEMYLVCCPPGSPSEYTAHLCAKDMACGGLPALPVAGVMAGVDCTKRLDDRFIQSGLDKDGLASGRKLE